jgi:branched-chain amino acid transport system permease protein
MKNKKIIFIVLLIVILACLPIVIEKESTLNLLVLILLYIILATSWNILGGYTGQTSLGHAAFFGLGSLATRLLWIKGVHIIPSILIGSLLAVVFALIIGAPAFRLKGVYFAIGTLALAEILNVTVGNMFPEIASLPIKQLVGYQLLPRYYALLGLAVFVIGGSYLLVNSKIGLGMMAVREEEDAAESLGVSALKHKLIALGVSAFFTGLAGGAFAFYHVGYYYQYPFSPSWSLDMLTMVYIGGQGTIFGPIIGAVFFVALKQYLLLNVGEYHMIIFGALFIIVVLFLPGGIVSLWGKLKKGISGQSKSNSKKNFPQSD